jgi:uncharacterized protein YlaI
MPCPNCGKPVSYLICVVSEVSEYVYDKDGYERLKESEKEEFLCPECKEIVALNEDEANEALGIGGHKLGSEAGLL